MPGLKATQGPWMRQNVGWSEGTGFLYYATNLLLLLSFVLLSLVLALLYYDSSGLCLACF